jgi:hypothetical protein
VERPRGNLNNVQYKSNQNCHCRSLPLYNEYILIKKERQRINPENNKK